MSGWGFVGERLTWTILLGGGEGLNCQFWIDSIGLAQYPQEKTHLKSHWVLSPQGERGTGCEFQHSARSLYLCGQPGTLTCICAHGSWIQSPQYLLAREQSPIFCPITGKYFLTCTNQGKGPWAETLSDWFLTSPLFSAPLTLPPAEVLAACDLDPFLGDSALLPGSERGWEGHGTHQPELEPGVPVPVSQNCRPGHCSESQAPPLWYGDGNGTSLTEMKCWEESVYRAPKTEPGAWDNQTRVLVPS